MENLDLFVRPPVTLEGVVYDLTEKQRACREFGMTESEIAYAYNH